MHGIRGGRLRRFALAVHCSRSGACCTLPGAVSRDDLAHRRRAGDADDRCLVAAELPGRSTTFGSWRLTYRRFDGTVATGRLIVHRDVARDVVGTFRNLYAADFPVRRMVPIDAYGASDFRSIEADNTTAFNCRFVDGTTRWSEHAYGRAIDVNPVENPYVSGGRTSHPVSRPYVERSRRRPGMAYDGGALVRAFDAIGWGLGRALDVGEGLPALLETGR